MICGLRLLSAITFAALAFALPATAEPAARCGWFSNPTPANASLHDKDGEWIVAVQGGHQADGDWPPAFAPKQWIAYGPGSYGYGCACMTVETDAATMRVTAIVSGKAKPLSACRKDPALKGVEDKIR